MKFTAFRRYLKGKNLSSPHTLKNCNLIVDGDSFFKDTYKSSGCQFILGPDCDRYADFIVKKLDFFIDNNVKCYFIFSGVTKHNIDKRKEIHQSIIGDRDNISRIDMVRYFEPLFVNDVQKQVLKQMDIPYFVCEYDSIEAIVGLARKCKYPVMSNNIEYSCFGVSCITPNSVEHDKSITELNCTIYDHEKVKTAIGVYNKMPLLLALLNESGNYLEKLSEIIDDEDSDVIRSVIRWIKRQKEATVVSTVARCVDDDQNKTFMDVYEKIQTVFFYSKSNLVVKHFERGTHGLFKDDKKWLAKGVSSGRIALPYINLKNKGVICGSFLMNDKTRPDALLAAIDIIAYSQCLLKNSQDSIIRFVGKTGNKISVNEIKTHWDKRISNRDIFTKHRVGKKLKLSKKRAESFKTFLEEVLPGFDFDILKTVPLECRILILTLVYYVFRKNNDFIKGAYCVLLSYVMLTPAVYSRLYNSLFILNKSPNLSSMKDDNDSFCNGLQFLFNPVDLKQKYNSTVVHNLSEFQHCLQHMNYLNKLCGEDVPCTFYRETFNATFIYNTFLFFDNENELMQYLEKNFLGMSRLTSFKNIVKVFENCLSVVKEFAIKSFIVNTASEENK